MNIMGEKIIKCEIDFDKVQTVEDIKNLLKGMNIVVFDDGREQFAVMRPYLKPAKETI